MWPIPAQFRVLVLAALAALVFVVGCWLGWKLNGRNVRAAQDALSEAQAEYQALDAKSKADALQRLKESVAKAKEIDDGYQAEIAKILAGAARRPARIVRVQCNAKDAVPAADTDEAGNSIELDGAAADRLAVGSAFRAVDLAELDAIRDEAKVVSARLRALQAVCGE